MLPNLPELLDLDPVPAMLHPVAPLPDDLFEIPELLARCRFAELEQTL